MVLDWPAIAAAAATLFFVMDPLGNIPIFNSVLARFDAAARRRIVARELLIALVILLGFLFAGNAVMSFLGLSESALQLSGGVLLFVIALRMIFPRQASEEDIVEEPFIVPLAMPMVAGPSAIAILLLLQASEPEKILDWTVALFGAWLASTIILALSPLMMRVLGGKGLRALERLMGMLLIMLSTQMMLNGVAEFVASLPARAG